MRIIVGLGNPGSEYDQTRHNIGYEVVDALAQRWGWTTASGAGKFSRLARSKFDGLAMDGQAGGGSEKVMLLKPTTYMNLSGRSVASAANFYQVPPTDLLVVLDDLALPCGRLRLRPDGRSGGHNGLKDIERALGTIQYPRLRIGIDPPPPPMAGKDYVLGRFTPQQRQQIAGAIDRACEAVEMWIDKGIEAAMNRFNVAEEDSSQ